MSYSSFLVVCGDSYDTTPFSFSDIHRRQLARDAHGRGMEGETRQASASEKEDLEGEASKVLYLPPLCAVVDLLERG